jgi:hypothetical protein
MGGGLGSCPVMGGIEPSSYTTIACPCIVFYIMYIFIHCEALQL